MKHTAVGIFVYAGGFSVGMSKKFNILAHLENTPAYASKTSQLNFPNVPIFEGPSGRPKFQPDVVYSNPPCAVFSCLGKNFGKKDQWRGDPRLNDWRDAVDYAIGSGAKAFVGESVPQLLTHGREFAAEQSRKLMDAGYAVWWYRHDLKFHGMPQQRRRVMILASKYQLEFPAANTDRKLIKQVLDDAHKTDHYCECADLEAELYQYVPEWGGFAESYDKLFKDQLKGKGRPRFVTHKIGYEGICGTVAGDYMFHPEHPRKLTVEEHAALCGYPADYQWAFDGSRYQYGRTVSEIARAVMPPVATAVAEILHKGIEAGKPADTGRTTLVTRWAKSPRRYDLEPLHKEEDITEDVLDLVDP